MQGVRWDREEEIGGDVDKIITDRCAECGKEFPKAEIKIFTVPVFKGDTTQGNVDVGICKGCRLRKGWPVELRDGKFGFK